MDTVLVYVWTKSRDLILSYGIYCYWRRDIEPLSSVTIDQFLYYRGRSKLKDILSWQAHHKLTLCMPHLWSPCIGSCYQATKHYRNHCWLNTLMDYFINIRLMKEVWCDISCHLSMSLVKMFMNESQKFLSVNIMIFTSHIQIKPHHIKITLFSAAVHEKKWELNRKWYWRWIYISALS